MHCSLTTTRAKQAVGLISGEQSSMVAVVLSVNRIHSRHGPAYVFYHLIVQGTNAHPGLNLPQSVQKSTGSIGEWMVRWLDSEEHLP
jgi:hypothetical protein